MLSKKDYYQVIKLTQIVSIDLLIKTSDNKYLLGLRKNNPAKNTLFNPGGKVFKGETLMEGVERILKDEVGISIRDIILCKFVGVFDHIYDNNFMDDKFGTHYVSHAYEIQLSQSSKDFINNNQIKKSMHEQHSEYQWYSKQELLQNKKVHQFVKNFFIIK